jgi:hypothetical protein
MVTHPLSRDEVRLAVPCPECFAEQGEPCRGRRSTRNGKPYRRISNHQARVKLATGVVSARA